jgi:hypothetical protein
MATASGEVGADPPFGHCARLRRELSGEPDVGNLHLRFDEGRVGRATGVALSPTLPALLQSGLLEDLGYNSMLEFGVARPGPNRRDHLAVMQFIF